MKYKATHGKIRAFILIYIKILISTRFPTCLLEIKNNKKDYTLPLLVYY